MKPIILLLIVLLLFVSCKEREGGAEQKKSSPYPRLHYDEYADAQWYYYYERNMLDSAQVYMEEHLKKHPKELPTLSFYAELMRRQKNFERADSMADKVLALDSSDGGAWLVKGDVRNPQYGKNEVQDSSRNKYDYYYSEGLKRDSTDGNLWEVMLFSTMQKGDWDQYRRGLRRLYSHGHFTSKVLAIGRLYLKQLPQDAILITMGDMDTYPLLAVQEAEELRQDVTIMNYSLMNLPWYLKVVCSHWNIAPPISAQEIDSLKLERIPGNRYEYRTIAKQYLDTLATFNGRKRPLCIVFSSPRATYSGLVVQTKGHYMEVLDSLPDAFYDLEKMASTRGLITPEEMKGDFISTKETSPLLLNVKRKRKADLMILWPLVVAASEKMKVGDSSSVELEEWLKNYCEVIGEDEAYERLVEFKRSLPVANP